MKAFAIVTCLLLTPAAFPQTTVPDAATAIRIAERALIPIYGKAKIESERPFHAVFEGDIWTVSGTLYCDDGHQHRTTNNCLGGTAVAKVAMKDGKILSATHYK